MHDTSVSPDTIRDTLMAAQSALDTMHDSLRTMRNCIDETRQQGKHVLLAVISPKLYEPVSLQRHCPVG